MGILFYVFQYLLLFTLGFFIFYSFEMVIRRYSFYSMGLMGGFCLICVGLINEFPITTNLGFIWQMIIGGCVITLLELFFGLLFNKDHKYWNYQKYKINFKGQISLLWAGIWILFSSIGILLDDGLRHLFFNGPSLNYHFF